METKYTKIRPEGMFTVSIERTMKHDARRRMYYEYAFTVEARKTQNDFVNLFAELIAHHGKRHLSFYAGIMGVNGQELTATLLMLTGACIREWTDIFASQVSETLLSQTTLSVGKIAAAVGWDSTENGLVIFNRWFTKRYKCSPSIWRQRNKLAE